MKNDTIITFIIVVLLLIGIWLYPGKEEGYEWAIETFQNTVGMWVGFLIVGFVPWNWFIVMYGIVKVIKILLIKFRPNH